MKRPHRAADGFYYIKGKKYPELFGSREQVMNGTAYKTAGELVKSQLVMNRWGRIVSKDKFISSKKENRLLKYGYGSRKGKFGYVRRGRGATKKQNMQKKKGTKKQQKGGDTEENPEKEVPAIEQNEDIPEQPGP